jgi:hypothetical protein
MLCDEHQVLEKYDEIIKHVMSGDFFDVIECDISVPDNLRQYFAEIPPIFKNTEIRYDDLSPETKLQVKSNYRSQKLVGSFFGEGCYFIQTY